MSARPFQVGDRVRITDHNRHDLHPEVQHVFEGIVKTIDPAAEPDSEYTYGPYLWAATEPYTSPLGGVFDRVFCPMTDDLADGADVYLGRSIELLEPIASADRDDDGTEAEVETPRSFAPPADADWSTAAFPDVTVHGRAPLPRYSQAGLASLVTR